MTEHAEYPQEHFWNHRVVRRVYHAGTEKEEVDFAIHEAHYDANVSTSSFPRGITVEPVGVYSDSVEGLREVLERMLRALNKPVVEFDEVGVQPTTRSPEPPAPDR